MEFLLFGSIWWFWILLTVASGLIVFFLETALKSSSDSGGGVRATAVVVGFIALYYFCGSKDSVQNFFEFVSTNAWTFVLLAGGYILAGVVWAFAKWYFFLLSKRDYLNKQMEEYTHTFDNVESFIPKAAQNKLRIISWMTYWPFSGLWTLINDPVRRAFQFVYSRIESSFDRISNSMFADQRIAAKEMLEERRRLNEERFAKK